jgi:hypothetical protein
MSLPAWQPPWVWAQGPLKPSWWSWEATGRRHERRCRAVAAPSQRCACDALGGGPALALDNSLLLLRLLQDALTAASYASKACMLTLTLWPPAVCAVFCAGAGVSEPGPLGARHPQHCRPGAAPLGSRRQLNSLWRRAPQPPAPVPSRSTSLGPPVVLSLACCLWPTSAAARRRGLT